ncbi:MAG: hypothetical protein Q7T45_26200 [Bradyrhizobium sp.]|uniref:hypothetical protein n=1 Tax=Bradyrhizobium sp. TaxID=376 RepID=UPI00271D1694|nr:hypothetical protein [Bradyrhizobium sp.]MDO8401304.1 hypothetical protein [Bradyrhizobium sp.]
MTEIAYSSRRHRTRALLAGTMTALLVACSFGAQAEDARIDEAVFDAQSTFFAAIVKVEHDGDQWKEVLPGNVGFDAHLKVDTKGRGYVERVGVWLGDCNGTECGSYPRILFEVPNQRDYDVNRSLSFPVEQLLEARSGALFYRKRIVDGCNAGPANQRHSFKMTVDATFSANTLKGLDAEVDISEVGWGFNGGDVTRHDTFDVTVDCLGPPRTGADRNADREPHRTKVTATGIDLFLQTFVTPASTQHGPSGTQCKPLKVTTRVATDKAGPVNVKLWRQVNGGAISGEAKQMQASALGGGKFGDDWTQVEHFTQTTTVQYKAEVLGGTFGPSTQWKSITIHCNGDFAPPQSNANPDNRNPPAGKPQNEARVPTIVTPPPRVTPPPPRIVCVGGKATASACACPPSTSAIQKSSTSFQCVKVAQVPDRRVNWQTSHASMPRRPMVQIKTAPGPRPQPMHRPFMRPGFR